MQKVFYNLVQIWMHDSNHRIFIVAERQFMEIRYYKFGNLSLKSILHHHHLTILPFYYLTIQIYIHIIINVS